MTKYKIIFHCASRNVLLDLENYFDLIGCEIDKITIENTISIFNTVPSFAKNNLIEHIKKKFAINRVQYYEMHWWEIWK